MQCSQQHEEGDKCELPNYCFHCAGNHSPTSKECPRKKFEQEVVEVAQNLHISIGSAKRQVMSANRDPSSSYASAIKSMKTTTNQSKMKKSVPDNSKSLKVITKEIVKVSESNFNYSTPDKTSKKDLDTYSPTDADLDSLPSLESLEIEKDVNPSDPCNETKDHSQKVPKKNKHEKDEFTTPNYRKRARVVSPKDNSKIKTSNKFNVLEETTVSEKETVPQGTISGRYKQQAQEGSQPKEHTYRKEKIKKETSKENSMTQLDNSKSKIPVSSTSHQPSSNRKKLVTENFGAIPKQKESQPDKDGSGKNQ